MQKHNPRVAIVADWITNSGGDDKVLWALHELFPKAPIFTTIFNERKMSHYKNCDIRTTYLNKLPLAKTRHQLFVPLMFRALQSFDLSGYDIIISSSHTVGKSITKPEGATHICYCHTPLRYVWAPEIDSLKNRVNIGFLQKPLLSYLKKADLRSAKSVDYFIANSKTIAERIKKAYDKDSVVIYPPVDTKRFKPDSPVKKQDYFMTSGRLIAYKRPELIVKACQKAGVQLKVAGTGPMLDNIKNIAGTETEVLGFIPDEKLVELYRNARGFIFAAYEDFGIVPVEAMAAGTPVIAYGKGGATETVVDGKTGILFHRQNVQSLSEAIGKLQSRPMKPSDCEAQAAKFDVSVFKKSILTFINKVTGAKK